MWETFLRLLFVLPFVILLMYVLARVANAGMQGYNQTRTMVVKERLALSKENTLYIIEIAGKYYLVSSCKGSMEILKEISKEEAEATGLERKSGHADLKDKSVFENVLKSIKKERL